MIRTWLFDGESTRGQAIAGLVLSCGLLWFLPQAGNALLWLFCVLILLGALRPAARLSLWRLALGGLYGACLALVLHLVADHFQLRYVWLYSSSALPLYLKVSNLWGGDEGTVLLLATFCLATAMGGASLPGWAGRGGALVAAWYVATAAWLGPFAATPADWLQAQDSQGMNAHLQTFWMALHAPLILAAYAWTLAPAGAAIGALGKASPNYGAIALVQSRRSWLVLTAGIGAGMAWALEDFTFGQLWHWDPVQTSAFAVWALLGAVLHGARRWREGQRLLPALSLMAAALVCVAMSVTRSEVLASSHRYIGTTSWMSHLALAAVLLGLGLWQAGKALGRRTGNILRGGTERTLDLAVYLFAGAALLAMGALLRAHLHEWLNVEKTPELKPFFELAMAWSGPGELGGLYEAFAQWDVDGYVLGKWLLPILAAFGLVGGYTFLRRLLRQRVVVAVTLAVSILAGLVAWRGGWLTRQYSGDGVLSQNIVAVLPWLDAALLGAAFLLVACLAWGAVSVWRTRRLGTLRHTGSLALIHGGAVVALVGGLAATALNAYLPITLPPSTDDEAWHSVSEQLQLRIRPLDSEADFSGYRAIAQVELRVDGELLAGQALFQDDRRLPPAYQGPMRQLCEILDYRYARHVGDPGYMLHPFIVRGWSQDLQVWVPASPRLMVAAEEGGEAAGDEQSLVVIRRYPFVSLLWIGLLAMLAGSLALPGRGR
ncbi:cytochrome c biogenesis protein CcsA [Zestomonas carbonaria]|uniref:Cytochrome c assembly protein domain-containing protein n=1 Tax=Zestomonas carbonaria TaxID=2762745 RepID=A0A7U7ESD2_9GAMM|nr:cytochrome c biogenesis protein CcsA [Pseudomonas carbonaria]CAD5110268.1 hypothetical protein PSEWESI4_04587 [Pseudomonas carbonaria]